MRAKGIKGKSKWQLSLTTSLLCELQKQVKVVQILRENTMRICQESEESEACKIERLGYSRPKQALQSLLGPNRATALSWKARLEAPDLSHSDHNMAQHIQCYSYKVADSCSKLCRAM